LPLLTQDSPPFAGKVCWQRLGEISITKLLVVAALVVLLFGTKKLRTLGGDLGAAIKGFKKAMNDDDATAKKTADADITAEKLSHKE
jgi:Sec-independent protein translocase protein TatE